MTRQTLLTRVLNTSFLACSLIGIGLSVTSARADDIRTERVHFPKGEIGTTIEGRITDREVVDYKLGQRNNSTYRISQR